MPVLAADSPTLVDLVSSLAPDGAIMSLAEILNETNEMLMDIPFMEANEVTGHRSAVRTGLPAPTWRRFYGRVPPGKSSRASVVDSLGMLEAYSEVDKALADLSGNVPAFRLQEDAAWIEAMSQAVQQAVFYGNHGVNPEQFNGLSSRYNSLSAANGRNIINAGGVGTDNASIWLIAWGPGRIFGVYPRGSQAGLQVHDKGQVTSQQIATDGTNSGNMEIYQTHYKWDVGIVVQDWRYAVRIANIDRSLLAPDIGSGANLPRLMKRAIERLPNLNGRVAFYMDRGIKQMLGEQIAEYVKNSTLKTEEVGGVRQTLFDGVPIRRCDRLAVDEAAVV